MIPCIPFSQCIFSGRQEQSKSSHWLLNSWNWVILELKGPYKSSQPPLSSWCSECFRQGGQPVIGKARTSAECWLWALPHFTLALISLSMGYLNVTEEVFSQCLSSVMKTMLFLCVIENYIYNFIPTLYFFHLLLSPWCLWTNKAAQVFILKNNSREQ